MAPEYPAIRPTASPQLWEQLADLPAVYAILELTDNPIGVFLDNRVRDSLEVEIDTRDGDRIEVRDNAGGVEPEQESMEKLISLAYSDRENNSGISYAGVGLKRGTFRLANNIRIVTQHISADEAYGFEIDREEFVSQERTPEIQIEAADEIAPDVDIEPGEFVVILTDLRINYNDEVGDERLRERIGQSYELYLADDDEIPGAYNEDISISVNGTPVEPQTSFDFGYPRWDELHPRQYTDIPIEHETLDDTVTMDLTVGLFREGDGNTAGTHLYCNGRKVLHAETGEKGGFGVAGDSTLKGFTTSSHKRLVVIIRLRSSPEGGAEDLPWRSNKSDIDVNHPVSRQVYRMMNRFVRPYMYYSYGAYPIEYHLPFPVDGPHNLRNSPEVDSKGRKKNLNYPGDRPSGRTWSYPESDKLSLLARIHGRLGISVPSSLEDWQLPTYLGVGDDQSYELDPDEHQYALDSSGNGFTGQLKKKFEAVDGDQDGELNTCQEVTSGPAQTEIDGYDGLDSTSEAELKELEDDVKARLNQLRAAAYMHVELGIKAADGVYDEWLTPRYNAYVSHYADDTDGLSEVDQVPDLADEIDVNGTPEIDDISNPGEIQSAAATLREQHETDAVNVAEKGYKLDSLSEWQRPVRRAAQRGAGYEIDDLTAVSDRAAIDESDDTEEQPNSPDGSGANKKSSRDENASTSKQSTKTNTPTKTPDDDTETVTLGLEGSEEMIAVIEEIFGDFESPSDQDRLRRLAEFAVAIEERNLKPAIEGALDDVDLDEYLEQKSGKHEQAKLKTN